VGSQGDASTAGGDGWPRLDHHPRPLDHLTLLDHLAPLLNHLAPPPEHIAPPPECTRGTGGQEKREGMGGRRRPETEREGERGGGGTDLAAPPGKASPARGQSEGRENPSERVRSRFRANTEVWSSVFANR
jgi:hypothetical protein